MTMKARCLVLFSPQLKKVSHGTMKISTIRLGLVLGMLASNPARLLADVTITSPTGGVNVSADYAVNSTNGPAFLPLGNIVITEGLSDDFAAGDNQTLILSVPPGWQFQAGVGTVSFTGSRDITSASIAVTTSDATITLTVKGTNNLDVLTIGGLQVQILDGANLSDADYIRCLFTNPGTATIAGVDLDFTTFGLLNEVAGTGRALTMQTQPGTNSTAG